MSYIYEITDTTDEEVYFTLGVFLHLHEAVEALGLCKDPSDLNSDGCHDDFCRVEIRERKLGWSGVGKKVYERMWKMEYNNIGDTEEYEWKVLISSPT